MTAANQNICVWAGVLAVLLFFIAFWPLLHLLPRWPPTESALDVARRYQEHTLSMRLGSVTLILAASMTAPFKAITQQQDSGGRHA
jgi:hypothetical protein